MHYLFFLQSLANHPLIYECTQSYYTHLVFVYLSNCKFSHYIYISTSLLCYLFISVPIHSSFHPFINQSSSHSSLFYWIVFRLVKRSKLPLYLQVWLHPLNPEDVLLAHIRCAFVFRLLFSLC